MEIDTDPNADDQSTTVTTTSAVGRVTTNHYGAHGEILFSQSGDRAEAPLEQTTYEYEDSGLLTRVATGDSVTTFTYDDNGHLEATGDALGRLTEYQSDLKGRVTRVTGPDGREVHLAYDANDNLTSLTMPGGQIHRFSYNGVDQTAAYHPPALGEEETPTFYTYNRDRQLTGVEWPDGRQVANEHNNLGQHRFRRERDGVTTKTLEYVYDHDYRLTHINGVDSGSEDPFPDVDLSYDYAGDLMKSETVKKADGSQVGKLELGYDARLRVGRISVTGHSGSTIPTYADYDDDGLLVAVGSESNFVANSNKTIEYDYNDDEFDGVALLNTATLDKSVDSYDYNDLAQIEEQSATYAVTGGANDVYRAVYEYDLLGRITRTTETLMTSDDASATTPTYSAAGGLHYEYDLAGQLKKVYQVAPGGVEILAAEYAYDDNGNRTMHWTPEFEREGEYDAQDRMVEYGGKTYEYNEAGQLTKETDGSDVTEYTYDMAGNLRKVVMPDETEIEYLIDGMSRRVGRRIVGDPEPEDHDRRWLYGSQLEPVAELDGSTNPQLVALFIYGSKPHVPDMIRSRRELDGTLERNGSGVITGDWVDYRVISDVRGNVRFIIRESDGVIVQRIGYDEFGNALFSGEADADWQPFTFCGGLFDTVTGLVRFGARDYDPEVGRWMTKDPIGLFGGNNIYKYCSNDPINTIDRFGACPDDWWDAFKKGAWDGYIGWSNGFLHIMSFGIANNYTDFNNPDQRFGNIMGTISGAAAANALGMSAIKTVNYLTMPKTLYHFRSAAGFEGITAAGGINGGAGLLGGEGVYLTASTSPAIATLQGAASTEAVVAVAAEGLAIEPLIIPGAFIVPGPGPVPIIIP